MDTFVDKTIYPVKMSAGGINAFYVSDCEHSGHRPSYCICVNKIQAHARDGGLRESTCDGPIRGGACPALAMRAEEIKADRAIYFVHRDKLQAFKDLQRVDPKPLQAPVKGKKPMVLPDYVLAQMSKPADDAPLSSVVSGDSSPLTDSIDDTGYAAVMTSEMAIKVIEPPKAEVEPSPPPVRLIAGESLLEMARRLARSRVTH